MRSFVLQKYLYGQLVSLFATVWLLFHYVGAYPLHEQGDVMGAVAAFTQVLGLVGPIYDMVSCNRYF